MAWTWNRQTKRKDAKTQRTRKAYNELPIIDPVRYLCVLASLRLDAYVPDQVGVYACPPQGAML